MKNFFLRYMIAGIVLALFATGSHAEDEDDVDIDIDAVEITDSAAITIAESLKQSIMRAEEIISMCVGNGQGSNNECMCKHQKELNDVKAIYDAALIRYPAWQGKMVTWETGSASGSDEDIDVNTLPMPVIEQNVIGACKR